MACRRLQLSFGVPACCRLSRAAWRRAEGSRREKILAAVDRVPQLWGRRRGSSQRGERNHTLTGTHRQAGAVGASSTYPAPFPDPGLSTSRRSRLAEPQPSPPRSLLRSDLPIVVCPLRRPVQEMPLNRPMAAIKLYSMVAGRPHRARIGRGTLPGPLLPHLPSIDPGSFQSLAALV
jgi:hypothetical protein